VVLTQQVDPIDPFESATFDSPQAVMRATSPPQRISTPHREPLGYSVSIESESNHEDEEDEESQLFPGSDIF
jgi:hypothetical protein